MDKQDEERVREIAREEALKCIQEDGAFAANVAYTFDRILFGDSKPVKTERKRGGVKKAR